MAGPVAGRRCPYRTLVGGAAVPGTTATCSVPVFGNVLGGVSCLLRIDIILRVLDLLLSSDDLASGKLPPDTAAWLAT